MTSRIDLRVLPMGEEALLVEVADTAQVMALAAVLRALVEAEEGPFGAVVDLVPAARTVLLHAATGTDLGALATAVESVAARTPAVPGADDDEDRVEIAVAYGGSDLAEVARLVGLTEREVVRAHTGSTWRVAFCGFAPGFGYLVDGDPRLRVPRHPAPRSTVPAGSVALAGEFSAVYPRSSPGGWQLIGSTEMVLWDLDRSPPALLRPGRAVRFVEEP
ncbi:5-oxoprolinase subunit B family protein [Ornithinimicrobium sediminis]|uniref:5-oxoprolinase subunit B family protein n=1 Tax=Ornithinimicrobium sediminis TaxID=2904603 RepID=UPI001E3D44A9|nr:allophanate hydrolase subunit 1 [Ornithinimicrobium sediminis]MCE0486930.1 allophanate hydrolase subunit 1 [Ornithinimicrobium sediminis]